MSKIFEALKKSKGQMREFTDTVVGETTQARTGSEETARSLDEPASANEQRSSTPPAEIPELEAGSIPVRLSREAPLLPFDGYGPHAATQYRLIRTKIVHHPRQPKLLLVASAERGDGKSVNAVNLAGALALNPDATVLLVDGDFRRSSIPSLLGVPPEPGLGDVLTGTSTLAKAVVRLDPFPNLYFLAVGKKRNDSAELLDSSNWRQLCETVRSRFTYVIIDGPPIGSLADYDLYQSTVDGVVVVIRQDHTNKGLCQAALRAIPGEKMLGVVMNCVQKWFLTSSLGYYYDYHYYGDDDAKESSREQSVTTTRS